MKQKLTLGVILIFTLLVGITSIFYLARQEAETPVVTPEQTETGPAKIGVTLFASNLGKPTAIVATNQKDDKRLFVLDQTGVIQTVDSTGVVSEKPFLDIKSKVLTGGEMGLLGMAFDPNYASNRKFYLHYTDKGQNSVIASYKVSGDLNSADAGSEEILLKVPDPYTNHNGGDLAFGPDGYLYIPLGDGGSAGDPENRAQNLGEFFGKILRIDVRKDRGYNVPSDNPFVNQPNAKAEIWTYGWRNPWRLSFDRKTGDLWIPDVGQGKIEEINLEKAGSKGGTNYGWRCYEGSADYNLSGCKDKNSYTLPLIEYDHSEGRCSVTGGYVYRGDMYKNLTGKYFFADYCGGQLYFAQQEGDKWITAKAIETPYKITAFGQDSSGELYLSDFVTGSVYKIEDLNN